MVRSAARAFQILELIGARREGLRQAEIAQALNIPKSTLSKLITSLVAGDYLTIDTRSRTYTIGPQVLVLANSYLSSLDVVEIAQPIVREAMMETGESASLMIKRGQEGLIVCKEKTAQPIIIARLSIGDRVPLYATAGGKAILAFLSAEEVDQYLSSVQLTPLTETTITDPDILRRELNTIRARGLARCKEEQIEGLLAIAAPVFGWDSRVVASITVPFPRIRSNAERERNIENVLRESSAKISRKLGLTWNSLSFN
jgi:DNA-binding IclR family transcriptional regulator